MAKFFQKRTVFAAILLGLVFFFGGVSTAFAAPDTADTTASSEVDSRTGTSDDAVYTQLNCSNLFKFTFSDCMAIGVYYAIYKPAALFLAATGYIFDSVLSLSITGDKVAPPFIAASWTVVRDFSNMIFIFILLYTGIMTMFGAADWRKVVLQVVVIALLINFSLFFTKVIIDAGNVLAIGIRSSISPGQSISEGLASSFQPQKFLILAGEKIDGGTSIIIFLVAAVVSGFAGYYFFKAALLFAGRLIAFWFLMIVSPFAFISTTLPKGNVFSKWLDTLLNQAFVAPVFLFFIYLIMTVISAGGGILEGFARNGDWFDALIGPVIIATLLVLALKKALEFAEKMAGDFGKAGSSFVSGAMGVASVATGGMAGFARQTVGRYAAAKLAGGTLEEGSAAQKAAQWATRSSFDVRNIGDKNSLIGKTMSGKVFQKEQGIGGREKVEKDRITKELKAAESGKLGVFGEQGVRSKTGALAKAKVAMLERTLADAQKAANESPTGKVMNKAGKTYEEAVSRRSRGGSEESVTRAKEAFEKAEGAHSSSSSSIALKSVVSKLEAAKKAEKAEAVAVSAGIKIAEENKNRKEAAIEKLEKAKRYVTADKIRNGEKGEKSVKETLEDLLKKEKETKEGSSEKPKMETEGEAKH